MTEQPASSTRRRANTRARILDAAAGVFAEKGLNGATVDELVGAAGYTRGAFYSNFATKEDVFYALFELQSERMVALVREAVLAPSDRELDLSLISVVLERLRPYAREWYLIQTEFLLFAMRNTEAGTQFLAHRNRFEGELAEVVAEALRRLGRGPLVPVLQLADVLSSLYMKNLAQEAIAGEQAAPDSFLTVTLPAVLMGLSEPGATART